jgi:hypothetical protein
MQGSIYLSIWLPFIDSNTSSIFSTTKIGQSLMGNCTLDPIVISDTIGFIFLFISDHLFQENKNHLKIITN